MEILSFDNTAFQTLSKTIDSTTYDFTAQYNKRDESWWMEVGLKGQPPVVRGKMSVGQDFLKSFRYLEGVPDRLMFLWDFDKVVGRADRQGFSSRFVPVLFTEEEWNGTV